jgi:hypothetical protein
MQQKDEERKKVYIFLGALVIRLRRPSVSEGRAATAAPRQPPGSRRTTSPNGKSSSAKPPGVTTQSVGIPGGVTGKLP